MSVIAQSYLIPLISGRHGRPATKLLSQGNNKKFSSKLNVLQLKSRTFCVIINLLTYIFKSFTLYSAEINYPIQIFWGPTLIFGCILGPFDLRAL